MSNEPAANNYTVQFANPLNNTDVSPYSITAAFCHLHSYLSQIYAESQPFEIKPLGASYPASASPSGSATATGASATPTKNSSPPNMQNSVAYSVALGAAVLGLITA